MRRRMKRMMIVKDHNTWPDEIHCNLLLFYTELLIVWVVILILSYAPRFAKKWFELSLVDLQNYRRDNHNSHTDMNILFISNSETSTVIYRDFC